MLGLDPSIQAAQLFEFIDFFSHFSGSLDPRVKHEDDPDHERRFVIKQGRANAARPLSFCRS